MNLYDSFMRHLDKNGECDRATALTLLRKYTSPQAIDKTLARLQKQKRIVRTVRKDGTIIYKPYLHPVEFVHKAEKEADLDTTLNDIAGIYRFLIRYGSQHYATPGRANTLYAARVWIAQRRDLIQFLNLLVELIDGEDLSLTEYRELEAGLVKAGWYYGDYDSFEALPTFVSLINPSNKVGPLGFDKADWDIILDPHSLNRIKGSDET